MALLTATRMLIIQPFDLPHPLRKRPLAVHRDILRGFGNCLVESKTFGCIFRRPGTMIYRKNTPRMNPSNSSSGAISPVNIESESFLEEESSSIRTPFSTGFPYYINKASKWAASALFAVIVIWKHDFEVLWALIGSILNVANSKLLKHALNHQRPASATGLKVDPGMPSSHAQSFGYLSVYAATSIIGWQGPNVLSIGAGILIITFGGYLAWLRVMQGLHTYDQVLVGACLGSMTAFFWYWLWKSAVAEATTSFMWVQIALLCVTLISCLGFLYNVFRNWTFKDL